MDPDTARRLRIILALAVTGVALGGGLDLAMDRHSTWLSFHAGFTVLMTLGALSMAISLWRGWWRAERRRQALARRVAARRSERDRWRVSARQALEGLGETVDRQFREWRLTAAEREVGLLLLRGCSHKRVGQATGRSERTAREHATVIYRKAGLGGRAELSAHFLEALILPGEPGAAAATAASANRGAPPATRVSRSAEAPAPGCTAPAPAP